MKVRREPGPACLGEWSPVVRAGPLIMNHNASVLDMAVIDSLKELGGEDDPGLLTELIDLFLADAPTYMVMLREAIESDDPAAMERAAHTLKSSSANIGALQLSELCRELEAAGRGQCVSGSAVIYQRTEQHYRDVCSALEGLRE